MLNLFKRKLLTENTRAFRRARSFCLIKYGLANAPSGKKTIVNPRNISAGGILFLADKELVKGTMLDIEVYLPPLKDFFTVIGSVVTTLRIRDTNQYWARVRFTAIDPADRNRINSYIETMSKQPLMQRHVDKDSRVFKRSIE